MGTMFNDESGGFNNGNGANGNGQTPGGATVIDEQPAQYPAQPEGDGQAQGQPEADPWPGELPAHMQEAFGVATGSELRERWEQAEKSAALVDAQKELIHALMQGGMSAGQAAAAVQQPAQPAAPAGFSWYGFGSQAKLQAAMAANPEGTMQMIEDWRMERFQEKYGKPAAPAQDPDVQRMKAHMADQIEATRIQGLQNKYEAARDPKLWAAGGPIETWAKGHGWLKDLNAGYPNVNAHEVAFKLWHYDVLAKQIAASNTRMAETRAGAGVARTGVGNKNVQPTQAKTHGDATANALERYKRAGGEVTPGMVAYLNRVKQGHDGGFQPRGGDLVA